MSWKCDICDTYCEERETICYVCGQERSAESIEEGKIRKRKEWNIKINNAIYDKGYSILKALFMVGALSSLGVVVVMLVIHLIEYSVDMYAINISAMANYVKEEIVETIWWNIQKMLKEIIELHIQNINLNINIILDICKGNVIEDFAIAQETLFACAKNNVENGFVNCIKSLKDLLSCNFSRLMFTKDELLESIKPQLNRIVCIVKEFIRYVEQYFFS